MSHFPSFLDEAVVDVAQKLLGCYIIKQTSSSKIIVKIVETEAYDQYDPASHSFRGMTNRTKVMFGPSGYLYVYFTYGMHYCCNIVVGPKDHGAAVLIRAVEPIEGREILEQYRPAQGFNITNGPAKLCQALAIDTSLNGHDLHTPPIILKVGEPIKKKGIACTKRIGIAKATDQLWRFYIKDNPYVSR